MIIILTETNVRTIFIITILARNFGTKFVLIEDHKESDHTCHCRRTEQKSRQNISRKVDSLF
ncbi:hypothetical protein B566_EDAN008742 [Ephemera danica]|nr:hypothetical protein B566_EDAN008742 [Ephemera danica]